MKPYQQTAVAEDLRKVGTTAVATALVGVFLSEHRFLTGCAFVMGTVIWFAGIYLTQEA